MTFATTPIAGPTIGTVDEDPTFPVMVTIQANDGYGYVYGTTGGSITQNASATMNMTTGVVTSDNNGTLSNVNINMTTGQSGWFRFEQF